MGDNINKWSRRKFITYGVRGAVLLAAGKGFYNTTAFHIETVERRDGARQTYISRGIGHLLAPIRINCPPEVTVLKLV